LLFRLVSTGIGRTAAAATLSWAAQFGIETDWSMTQLADHGECDRKTISNAIPALKAAGFVEQVSDHVFVGFKKPGNRSGIYRFTEEFYAMVGKARKASRRREIFPTPSALEVPICTVPTNVQHQHEDRAQDSNAMPVSKSLKEELREGVEAAVEPVVEDRVEPTVTADQVTRTLVEVAGLDEAGARAAAKALPSTCSGELVRFFIQAAQEVVGQRGQGVRDPKAYLHRLLTSGDQGILRTARKLYEDSKAAAKTARSLGVDQVLRQSHPSFRALPGALEAIQECLRAKKELEALPAGHNSRSFYSDQLGKAKTAVVDLAARAIGAGGPPQSILDRWTWRRRVLEQAGLNLDDSPQTGPEWSSHGGAGGYPPIVPAKKFNEG
jgi:DNA-binding transcriptional regulator GbsR (MarR family)